MFGAILRIGGLRGEGMHCDNYNMTNDLHLERFARSI